MSNKEKRLVFEADILEIKVKTDAVIVYTKKNNYVCELNGVKVIDNVYILTLKSTKRGVQ